MTPSVPTVNIRPGVGILSVLRHLPYKPWFALAEFVDNSLNSYLTHRQELTSRYGPDYRLRVVVEIDRSDEMRIIVRDNAAGIAASSFPRAFRPAQLPPDTTGLSEFGMGMKSAAAWFAPRWRVRTIALGELVERVVSFDIAEIVHDAIEELAVSERRLDREQRAMTEITLFAPSNQLLTRTAGKIKEHLSSIYRNFLRDGTMELIFDDAALSYETPAILVCPPYDRQGEPIVNAAPRPWRRDFDFDFGLGLRASGFVALRAVGSTKTAGLALFRRRRLIEGSADEPYRPEKIFGSGNSYRRQRLFGEIELEGFDVSHTKDGFKWADLEDTFLEFLREKIDGGEYPILAQAERIRTSQDRREIREEAERANNRVAASVQSHAPSVLEQQVDLPPVTEPAPQVSTPDITGSSRQIEVTHRGTRWKITIELSLDPALEDWLWIADRPAASQRDREITVRISLAHPFMIQFCRPESAEIEALERVAVAIALAEVTARDSGVPLYGTIRRNINQLLRDALSRP